MNGNNGFGFTLQFSIYLPYSCSIFSSREINNVCTWYGEQIEIRWVGKEISV